MKWFARQRFRLWQTCVWWKHSWWFQFAHGPLCERFRTDVLRLGRWHICRSCTLLYSAIFITAATMVMVACPKMYMVAIGYGFLVPLTIASYPSLYKKFPRWTRDIIRFGTGVTLAMLFGLFTTSWWWLGASTFAILYVLFQFFKFKRREVKRTECDGCPELGGNHVCSGYHAQAESIRAYSDCVEKELNKPEMFELTILQQNKQKIQSHQKRNTT